MVGSVEWYVWNVEMVAHTDGRVSFLTLELQSMNGDYVLLERDANELSAGWTQIYDAAEANGGDWIEYTDEAGRLTLAHKDEFGAGAIGPGGVIALPGLINRGGCRATIGFDCSDAFDDCTSWLGEYCQGVGPVCYCSLTSPIPTCSPTRVLNCANVSCQGDCNAGCHCI